MQRLWLLPCLLVLWVIGGSPSHAQGAGASTYHVEVIIFRTNGAREGEPGAAPPRAASGDAASGAAQVARYSWTATTDALVATYRTLALTR